MKTFPIQASNDVPGFFIPWSMAEKAYEFYVKKLGRVQTLERLAERDGFDWLEFVLLYCGSSHAFTQSVYIEPGHVVSCTQRVVADLVEELTNGK